jgi:hypothetical protein
MVFDRAMRHDGRAPASTDTYATASFRRWDRYTTRRARSSEQRVAPVGRKPAKTEFDPQAFLAKVGAGKTILKIKRNQHVEADAAFAVSIQGH